MKNLIVLSFSLVFLFANQGISCSMYKLTKDGKTIVGNNEDWTSPNGQFWFEEGTSEVYGVMYMGFLDQFAQGAINEAGLVFDGFWEPYLEVKDTEGKLEIPIGDAIKMVMQTMNDVEEVQSYLQTINLSILENGQLVFIDKNGKYLIIEGDVMMLGDENEKTFSNFYYSQIKSLEEVNLDYFQKGQNFINSSLSTASLDYCSEVMGSFAQSKLAPTQYTTTYDLNSLKIRIYLFHDFTEFIELDLKKELEKGNHQIMIANLFPKTSIGFNHFEKYNNPDHPTLFLEEFLGDKTVTEEEFIEYGFDNIIRELGNEWLFDIKNPEGAIKVFKYGVELMPNNYSSYDSLGAAFFRNENWNDALICYTKSLALNPENKDALSRIREINELKEKQNN